MTRPFFLASLALLVLLAMASPRPAQAAQGYDSCSGFITSLPAVIATGGTWCLKTDLSTAVTSGAVIAVNTNNVTIDCNDFKLGGLAAGAGTSAYGIFAVDHANITVRHCNIRGFYIGVRLFGASGGGHLVEDNRFDGNTEAAMLIEGDGSLIRRNLVFNTGLTSTNHTAVGISADYSVDVLDNTISGVTATPGGDGPAYGVATSSNPNGRINGNRVRGVVSAGSGVAVAVKNASSGHATLRGNDLVGTGAAGSIGISCQTGNDQTRDNVISGYATAIATCDDDGSNYAAP